MAQEMTTRLIREWERALRGENKSPNTTAIYLRAARDLATWLANLPTEAEPGDLTRTDLIGATAQHISGHVAHLVETTSPGNAHNHYRSLRQLYNWLLREEEIDAHPMATMKPPQYEAPPVPVIPDDLVRKVLDSAKGRDLISLRDTAIIRLIWDTGCRLAEIAKLNVDDVDLDTDRISIIAKGRRPRVVAFSPKTGTALSRYLRARDLDRYAEHPRLWLAEKGKGPLTPNGVKLMLRRRGKAAGVNDEIGRNLHAHLGRHSYAHEWQIRGGSESALMYNLGWKSRAMVDRYAKSAAEQRAQQAAREMRIGDRL